MTKIVKISVISGFFLVLGGLNQAKAQGLTSAVIGGFSATGHLVSRSFHAFSSAIAQSCASLMGVPTPPANYSPSERFAIMDRGNPRTPRSYDISGASQAKSGGNIKINSFNVAPIEVLPGRLFKARKAFGEGRRSVSFEPVRIR